jgi:hypothetical protein
VAGTTGKSEGPTAGGRHTLPAPQPGSALPRGGPARNDVGLSLDAAWLDVLEQGPFAPAAPATGGAADALESNSEGGGAPLPGGASAPATPGPVGATAPPSGRGATPGARTDSAELAALAGGLPLGGFRRPSVPVGPGHAGGRIAAPLNDSSGGGGSGLPPPGPPGAARPSAARSWRTAISCLRGGDFPHPFGRKK